MSEALQWLLAACAGIVTLATAGEKLKLIFSPVSKAARRLDARLEDHEGRITRLERHEDSDLRRIVEAEETSRLLCNGIFCLLEAAEKTAGPEDTESIRAAKKELRDYIIRR